MLGTSRVVAPDEIAAHATGTMRRRLRALTSLRFFAASAIVWVHLQSHLDLPQLQNLGHGVAFFFVLSGFVMTYAYPSLRTTDWPSFIVARFARIWPANVVAIIVTLVIFYPWQASALKPLALPLVTNLTMIQSWVPLRWFTISIDPPAWSIATEFAFYFLFPFLILSLAETWWWKLLGSLSLVGVLIVIATVFSIPWSAAERNLDGTLLLYNFPGARLFEFVVGMCAALLWQRLGPLSEIGFRVATALEIFAIGGFLANWYLLTGGSAPFFMWYTPSGSAALPAAFVILVMAYERGAISKLLTLDAFVLLGEISYSIYLLHLIAMNGAIRYMPIWLPGVEIPQWLFGVVVVTTTLIASYAVWRLIERPARDFITRNMRRILIDGTRRRIQPSSTGVVGSSQAALQTPASVSPVGNQ